MKPIYLISGSWPPDVCGVGDHINRLRLTLMERGLDAKAVRLSKYGIIQAIFLLYRSWFQSENKAILAYPTEGYGRSVVPFMLIFCRPGTLLMHMHEYRSKNSVCRWLLRLYRHQPIIFFSNTGDRDSYIKDTKQSSSTKALIRKVLPSPSNIKPLRIAEPMTNTGNQRILHFGQIRPQKGIEDVVKVFKHIKSIDASVTLIIAGAVPLGYQEFADELRKNISDCGISLRLGLNSTQLSELIAESDVMFLPYPHGADEKRGTLAAGLAHGVVCVTTHGNAPALFLRESTIGIDPIQNAASSSDWIETSAKRLIHACTQARHGELETLRAAALRYSAYASFQTLADESLKALYPPKC